MSKKVDFNQIYDALFPNQDKDGTKRITFLYNSDAGASDFLIKKVNGEYWAAWHDGVTFRKVKLDDIKEREEEIVLEES